MWELTEQARERTEAEAAEERRARKCGTPSSGTPRRRKPKLRSGTPGTSPGTSGKQVAGRRLRSTRRGRRCGRRC